MGDCYHGNNITLNVCVVQKCTLSLYLALTRPASSYITEGRGFLHGVREGERGREGVSGRAEEEGGMTEGEW